MTTCPSPTAGTDPIHYRPLRAPREDRGVLVEPPMDAVPELVAGNVALRGLPAYAEYDCGGRTLGELSLQARRELLDEAYRWTSAYRDAARPAPGAESLVFLAGHQPQLFHPGVWLKNFALGALARRHGATAVNLVIDGDAARPAVASVPAGSPDRPRKKTIAFDRHGPEVAYEERRILDRELFADFGRQAARRMLPLGDAPLLEQFWPLVERRMADEELLGACLAQARHQLEGRWGLDTLEVPQSRVCDAPSFRWFMVHLLAELPRLHDAHNRALHEYRRLHRLRGDAHPAPDLGRHGDWLEAPFWVWTPDRPRRRRLFVRRRGAELVLADEEGREVALPGDDPVEAVARLGEARRGGVKIRSRALVTTMWARLVLGDLFLHGIGGAKYDQVTDRIIADFFGLAPPKFMVLSATLLLPVERAPAGPDDLRTIRRQLRELTFHPEGFLDTGEPALPGGFDGADGVGGMGGAGGGDPRALAAEKRRWIETPPTPENAGTRYRTIRRLNEAMQPFVAGQRRQLERLEAATAAALAANAVLAWREYAFCLYPDAVLRDFFTDLLGGW